MRKLTVFAALCVAFATLATSPVSAVATVQSMTDGVTVDQIATEITGPGVAINSITFGGSTDAAGVFTEDDPSLYGFDSGAILSSGTVGDAVGPNLSPSTSTEHLTDGDADLTALAAQSTYDAVSLSIDFVPDASTVYISYVFGSEEYNEWVGSFNDVFAFYVNGVNCAVTDMGEPVTVNSINGSVNADLYIDNTDGLLDTEMDGFTVPLTCSAAVNPGVANTMKLVLADAGDYALDSWVILANSGITTDPPEICDDGIDNDNDGLIDGDDPDCQHDAIVATKYYDANANGMRDDGEAGIADWPIQVSDELGVLDTTTGADGTVALNVADGDYTVSEGLVDGWMNITADSVDVTVAADTTVEVAFGNVCLGDGGGHTKGYWQNRNGAAAFAELADPIAILTALPLEDDNADTFDPVNYDDFRHWIRSARAKTPSYMLSAQLSAMVLNVEAGMVSPDALVYAPDAASANDAGFTTVAQLINEAIASLTDGTDDLSLSKALDAANSNMSFVQAGPEDCPAW